ncbi:MAG: hypothetical protein EPO32_02950 [Anaerolineae bacterium]|nr:MAG: hypothetical protein EPO32_02950 [Anaerolineae bacterium]
MSLAFLSLPALAVVLVSSVFILGSSSWRLRLIALGLQYIAVTLLVSFSWPLPLAAVKLVAGWMAGGVLGISRGRSRMPLEQARWPAEWMFRLLATVLVFLAVASLVPQVVAALPQMSVMQAWGGLSLVGMGLLSLGFSQRTFASLLGLLTFLSGFEILYAVVEESTLVAGLLAFVNLGIALSGSYLMDQETEEGTA